MKNKIKEIVPYIIIIVVVALLRIYIITPEIVSGDSMENTLHDGEWILNSKILYRYKDIKRFDIVVIKYIINVYINIVIPKLTYNEIIWPLFA